MKGPFWDAPYDKGYNMLGYLCGSLLGNTHLPQRVTNWLFRNFAGILIFVARPIDYRPRPFWQKKHSMQHVGACIWGLLESAA